MGKEKKAEERKKKTRTRQQEERNYRIFYAIVWPIWNLLFPIKTLHRERIPDGACIFCPNHTSLADPPMVCFAVTRKYHVHIMAKKSLMELPILGRIFDAIGTFGVDRGNNDINAIKSALRVLKDGRKLLMFPEGTRVGENEEGDAKTGAAMLAMKTGAPLVPIFMTRKKRLFRRSTVIIGEPYTVHPAGKRASKEELSTAADELLRRVYALEEETH